MTDEHIFPDALGGRIKFPILCKDCNSNVGTFIDGPFLRQKNVELARSTYRLKSRKNNIPQPFSEIYSTTIDGDPAKFRLDENYSAVMIPTAPIVKVHENGSISITVGRDFKEIGKLPKIFETTLRRFFNSEEGVALGWSADKIESSIRAEVESVREKVTKAKENGGNPSFINSEISGTWSIDLKRIFSEHVKILYEIACVETDGKFSESESGKKMREFLYAESKNKNELDWVLEEKAKTLGIVPFFPKNLKELFENIFEQDSATYHLAVITSAGVFASTLGFGAGMQVNGFSEMEDPKIYFNSVIDDRLHIQFLSEVLNEKHSN